MRAPAILESHSGESCGLLEVVGASELRVICGLFHACLLGYGA